MVNTSNPTPAAAGGLVGRVVAGRYRVVGIVTTGANTLIADAVDLEHDVPVTVKILRPDLGEDPEFRERFRETARAASALAHPNIASVLDWGDFAADGRSSVFWVVEHLAGGSLRDLLDRGRLLTPSQALVVGLEACRALDAAHKAGEVHTEITPAKLVFGTDRRLRIVDFGMAHLLGAPTWEEPARVPTHVARYASPEQALRLEPDAKTDVYALSLCLLETVTGTVPFSADSTVATLSARVGKLLPVSADLGSLAAVLERAARPDAEDRSTAAEFGQGLVQAAGSLPRPEPVPILSTGRFDSSELRRPTDPTGGFARPTEPPAEGAPGAIVPPPAPPSEGELPAVHDATEPGSAAAVTVAGVVAAGQVTGEDASGADAGNALESDRPKEPGPATAGTPVEEEPTIRSGSEPSAATFVATTPLPAVEPTTLYDAAPDVYDGERRGPRVGRILLIIVLVIAGIAALSYAGLLLFRTKSHEVPELAGQSLAVAQSEIAENEWVVVTERERDDDFPDPDTVIRTDPVAGVMLDEGAEFTMVVSDGPEFRTLEEYAGLPLDEATGAVEELALEAVTAESRQFSETVPAGSVVSWTVVGSEGLAAGAKVLPGETVEFTVSKGPRPRVLPDLVNMTVQEASAAIEDLQLRFRQRDEVFSDTIEAGRVASQMPGPGEKVDRGSRVSVEVSKGPDVVPLPDVEGLKFAKAVRILEREDFEIGSVLGTTDGNVISTSVDGSSAEAGELYRRGTIVDIVSL